MLMRRARSFRRCRHVMPCPPPPHTTRAGMRPFSALLSGTTQAVPSSRAPPTPQVAPQSRRASNEFILPVPDISDDKPSFLETKHSSARSRRCCLHKSKSPPQRARSPPRPFGRPHVTPASPPTRGLPTLAPWHAPCLAPDREVYPRSPAAHLPTPWQELRANPSTYKGQNWRNLFVLFKLRSELPRGPREDHHVGSAGSRAVRNEGRRAVVREPIGPCRSTLVHMCGAVRVPTCIVKLG